MKALSIKYVPATNTAPTRLRVSAEQCKPVAYSVDSFDPNDPKGIHAQAARRFSDAKGWFGGCEFAVGQLPNGTFAAVAYKP